MNYLHYEVDLGPHEVVEVSLDGQANVRLMDDANFATYQRGAKHHYYGGFAKESPVQLRAPRAGHWHLVIDLGGYAGTVRASFRVLQGAV